MRHLKNFGIALAIIISGNALAIERPAFSGIDPSKTYEISKLLEDDLLLLEKDHYGRVVFYLNEEKEIRIYSVICSDPFVREYVNGKMNGEKLLGRQWETGKTYIFPIKMKLIK